MALWYDVMGRPSFLAPFLWETLFFEQELQVLGHFEVAVLPGGDGSPVVGEQCEESSQDISSSSCRAGWLAPAYFCEVGEVLAPPG